MKRKKKFVTLVLDSMFGPFEKYGEIIDEKEHGYNLPSGGWSLHKLYPEDKPAKFLIFREKGKRKLFSINEKFIIEIKEEK